MMVIGFAGLIIALAGFAGWSSGQRIAQGNATATTSAVIIDQVLDTFFVISKDQFQASMLNNESNSIETQRIIDSHRNQ